MTSLLTLRARPTALAHLRDQGGLRADQIDRIPGASGSAKCIGSWRMACLAQRDPVAALARGHEAYIYHQRYTPKPDAREGSGVLARSRRQ